MKQFALLSLDKFGNLCHRVNTAIVGGIANSGFTKTLLGISLSGVTMGSAMIIRAYFDGDFLMLVLGISLDIVFSVLSTLVFIIMRETIAEEVARAKRIARKNHPTGIGI